jgi:tRNA-Thr(GGU) m(6)t(6)A37 methyltransferase TsaA
MKIWYEPIGIIRSPFNNPTGTPNQPTAAEGVVGTVEIWPKFQDGLRDIDGFSHILLIYHLHLSDGFSLLVTPHQDHQLRGVFATRTPNRPNPIGLSIVRLESVDGPNLRIRNVDIVDRTPLLDLKPCIPELDTASSTWLGWIEDKPGALNGERNARRSPNI